MKRTILLAISILLVLSACSSPKPAPVSTSTQALTNTPVPPSKTPEQTPAQLPTLVFVVTPQPTFDSLAYTQTPPAYRIDLLLQKLAKKFSITIDYPHDYYTCLNPLEISPDGKWAIIGSSNPNILGSGYRFDRLDCRFNVVSTDGNTKWVTPFYSENYGIYSETLRGGTFPRYFGSMQVEHWSKDGNYLYFSAKPFADGAGLFNELFPERYIYRLDLRTGDSVNTQMEVGAVFSPSDRFVVYGENKAIHVIDLAKEEEKIVDLPKTEYDFFGRFIWSPDETQIAFTIGKYNKHEYATCDGVCSVFLLNVEDRSFQLLIDNNKYYTYAWTEPNFILLVDYSNPYGTPNAAYNIFENQFYNLHRVTATP